MESRVKNLKRWLSEAKKSLKEGLESGKYVHPSDATNLNNSSRNGYFRMCGVISQYEESLKELKK